MRPGVFLFIFILFSDILENGLDVALISHGNQTRNGTTLSLNLKLSFKHLIYWRCLLLTGLRENMISNFFPRSKLFSCSS